MAFFDAPDGTRLHYELEGTGPTLIFHLGAGCDSGLWRAAGYCEALAESNSCVLFDHRGHGISDHPATVEANHVDRYADDVIALVNHLDQKSSTFFGWSNGVTVGLRAADKRPELFEALILFDAVAPAASPVELEEAVRMRVLAARERGWWYLLDDMIAAEKHPVPQWMIDRIVATDMAPYIAFLDARTSWNWNPWDALPDIAPPTLFLVGELEDPDDLARSAAERMPSASRIRIPGVHHINAFLNSGAVLPVVGDFLTRVRSSA